MAFSKTFPKEVKGSKFPQWEEVYLTEQEEREQEQKSRAENITLMKESISDAKAVMKDMNLKDYQSDVIHMAIALFEKRASHTVYHKENKTKEKFDQSR